MHLCFSTFSHKRDDFRENVTEHETYVVILSTAFLILGRIKRDIIIHKHKSSSKYPLFLPYFKETRIFSTDLRKPLKYHIT